MQDKVKNSLCGYCLGCNRLIDIEFKETRNCSNFMPAYDDWQEKFYERIKNQE